MNELLEFLNYLKTKGIKKEEFLEFIYILKAWEKLSKENKINNKKLLFNNNFESIERLIQTLKELKEYHKVFELFSIENTLFNKVDIKILTNIYRLIENQELPRVNDVFFTNSNISNQTYELGIKLLNRYSGSLYLPFLKTFAMVYYTDKEIYAENSVKRLEFIAELINIIEDKNITYKTSETLEKPAFIDSNKKLQKFNSVLAFPDINLKSKYDFTKDEFNRFKFQKYRNLDLVQFEHILAQTEDRAVVLVPIGFTFRTYEKEFRKYLIENNLLEAIIELPSLLNTLTTDTVFFVINNKKNNEDVYFINLKDNKFLKRDGKKIVLKDIDEIIELIKNKKEIEDSSILISNKLIMENECSLAVDKYIFLKSNKNKLLDNFKNTELKNIAIIKKAQDFKDEEKGDIIVYEISPLNLANVGFTTKSNKIKRIDSQINKLPNYLLKPYDILISTKGTIGKVGIIGDINSEFVASQAMQCIRLNDERNLKNRAIELYMFFKSDIGQSLFKMLSVGTTMPQISTNEISKLKIPLLSLVQNRQIIDRFYSEIEMYKEIEKIQYKIKKLHSNFLEFNIGGKNE